jgi:hypothetical protein
MGIDKLREHVNRFFPYLMLLPATILSLDLFKNGWSDIYNLIRVPIVLLLFLGGTFIIIERIVNRITGSSYYERRYKSITDRSNRSLYLRKNESRLGTNFVSESSDSRPPSRT